MSENSSKLMQAHLYDTNENSWDSRSIHSIGTIDTPERRTAERVSATYLPCCVISDKKMTLGLLRNFSEGGAQIEIETKIEVGSHIIYFHDSLLSFEGTVVWRNKNSYGIRHSKKSIVQRLRAYPHRSVRIPCQLKSKFWIDGNIYHASVENISLGGIQVRGLPTFTPGTLATAKFCNKEFEVVTIKWSNNEIAGLQFGTRLSRHTLIQIIQTKYFSVDWKRCPNLAE